MPGYVYILASKRNGTLYVGITSDIVRRVSEHKQGLLPGFTRKYGVKTLVYYEVFDRIDRYGAPAAALTMVVAVVVVRVPEAEHAVVPPLVANRISGM